MELDTWRIWDFRHEREIDTSMEEGGRGSCPESRQREEPCVQEVGTRQI
jgi:hypothetical protein